MKDRRKINKVWQACSPLGKWYTYAIVGSGKNSFVATLSNGAMAYHYQSLVGTEYFNGRTNLRLSIERWKAEHKLTSNPLIQAKLEGKIEAYSWLLGE